MTLLGLQHKDLLSVGVIGVDSSHTFQFSRRIQDLHACGKTRCRVTVCCDAGSDTALELAPLRDLGIPVTDSFEDVLSTVDAVMVLNVDGNQHFRPALRALELSKPVFIDKPLTCSAAEAAALVRQARASGARCYSASALRFAESISVSERASLGRVQSIEVTGPFQETVQLRGLWYYGCHSFELLDSLWPQSGGIRRVRATRNNGEHRIELDYFDGRSAVIGLDSDGTSPFVVRLSGANSSCKSVCNLTDSYDRLVTAICEFFEGAPPGTSLENSAEITAAIECAHRSLANSGAWIPLGETSSCRTHNGAGTIPKN